MKIPKGHQPVMPYLILKDAAAFIPFTEVVFGAKLVYKGFRDNDEKLLAHAEIQLNGCNILFADVTEDFGQANANLFIYVESADETFRKALDHGCTVANELADQVYGRSGGVTDPFGNVWWITSLT